MRRRACAASVLVLAGSLFALGAAPAAAAPVRSYRVTITNLTTGQPMTPPVVAVHRRSQEVFEVGDRASFGVKEIAENGNNAPLLSALQHDDEVFQAVQAGNGPLVPPGTPKSNMFANSVTLTVSGGRGAKVISVVAMLICTNDGFTGVDSLRLPKHIGETVAVRANAYDAGTERDTEDLADIVPPCQTLSGVSSGEPNEPGVATSNPALAEGQVIHHHAGIQGIDDLPPSVVGWRDPVAAITVERTS